MKVIKTVNVNKNLWSKFLRLCKEHNSNASREINILIENRIEEWNK